MFARQFARNRRWPLLPAAWQGLAGAVATFFAALAGFLGTLPSEARWLILLSLWSLGAALAVRRKRGSWID